MELALIIFFICLSGVIASEIHEGMETRRRLKANRKQIAERDSHFEQDFCKSFKPVRPIVEIQTIPTEEAVLVGVIIDGSDWILGERKDIKNYYDRYYALGSLSSVSLDSFLNRAHRATLSNLESSTFPIEALHNMFSKLYDLRTHTHSFRGPSQRQQELFNLDRECLLFYLRDPDVSQLQMIAAYARELTRQHVLVGQEIKERLDAVAAEEKAQRDAIKARAEETQKLLGDL